MSSQCDLMRLKKPTSKYIMFNIVRKNEKAHAKPAFGCWNLDYRFAIITIARRPARSQRSIKLRSVSEQERGDVPSTIRLLVVEKLSCLPLADTCVTTLGAPCPGANLIIQVCNWIPLQGQQGYFKRQCCTRWLHKPERTIDKTK